MCGILCYVSAGKPCEEPSSKLVDVLKARGPDHYGYVTAELSITTGIATPFSHGCDNSVHVRCHASVLSLRGSGVTAQPVQQAVTIVDGSSHETVDAQPILCWNGEIFGYGKKALQSSRSTAYQDSDYSSSSTVPSEHALNDEAVATGHPASSCSLTLEQSDSAWLYDQLCEAARADQKAQTDSPIERDVAMTSAVSHVLDSIHGPFAFVFVDTLNQRLYYGRDRLGRRSLLLKYLGEDEVCFASVSDGTPGWSEIVPECRYSLDLRSFQSVKESPNQELQRAEGLARCSAQSYRYQSLSFNDNIPATPSKPLNIESSPVSILQSLLSDALDVRLTSLPTCANKEQARFAVLFSGGLDCTTLARIMHDILPHGEPVDLLNVAFENPRISGGLTTEEAYSLCPDRVTALMSHAELKTVCPGRDWCLIKIDVPYTETLAHRPTIKRLMYPHDTEMDLSIASALYFASRGEGHVQIASHPLEPSTPPLTTDTERITTTPLTRYRTPARVLISGLGADELFAGYQRHATAFSRGGYAALLAELKLDYERLGTRNLGRDDRVLSHWGRECRFPFLDERVVQWAVAADVSDKCGFGAAPLVQCSHEDESRVGMKQNDTQRLSKRHEDDIDPGKRVLRLVADRLGMHGVAREKKRAIQFGARSAKMESGRSRGTDVL